MFVTTMVVGAVITASGGSVKATGMFVRDIGFNLAGSTALFFMCLTERATLEEAGCLFAAYLVYVVAVTQVPLVQCHVQTRSRPYRVSHCSACGLRASSLNTKWCAALYSA